MNTHRWLAGCVAVLLLAGAAPGQEEGEQARKVRQVQERVQAALALTPEQESLLRDLRDRLQDELHSIRTKVRDGELSVFEGHSQLRDALRAQRQARDDVLTPDQKALLARGRRYARALQTAVPRPLQPEPLQTNLVEALHLTETQQLLWQDLIARQRTELAALREFGEAATPEDIRQLRREHRQVFEAMLTLQQRDDLRRLRVRWRERQQADPLYFNMGWNLGEEPLPQDERWDEPTLEPE